VPQKNLPRIRLLVKWTERTGPKKSWNFAEVRALSTPPPLAQRMIGICEP
jgi:hypothetical protein